METVADIFNSDIFSATTMTDAINELAFVPQFITSTGLFEPDGVPTTTVFIEKRGESLEIIQTTERGAAGVNLSIDRRLAVPFTAVHLQPEDRIKADEIQNVLSFGSARQLMALEELRDQRLRKMSRSLDFTLEYHKLGAIQGLVLDKDGSPIEDLYDKFAISPHADVPMQLDAAWTEADGGFIVKKINPLLRGVDDDLDGNEATGYLSLCGDDFFDALIGHPERRETYKFQSEAASLRDDFHYRQFNYGGIQWVNYRGRGACKIAATTARLVPLGVPELFRQLFAPADTFDHVNTMGEVKYAWATPDPSGKNKFMDLEAQSNPITFCSRPKVLRKLLLGS